jgi:hypothetical protein
MVGTTKEKMGKFAETTDIDYSLSFTDQGKQTSVINISMCVNIYIYIYIYAVGKLKPRRFSIIPLPFDHCANGSLLFACSFTNKKMEVIRLQRD